MTAPSGTPRQKSARSAANAAPDTARSGRSARICQASLITEPETDLGQETATNIRPSAFLSASRDDTARAGCGNGAKRKLLSFYPDVKDLGPEVSLVGLHSFSTGPCNPRFREEVIAKLNEAIDVATDVGCRKVITLTGMRFDGMDPEKAVADCLSVWKTVLPHAEKKGSRWFWNTSTRTIQATR